MSTSDMSTTPERCGCSRCFSNTNVHACHLRHLLNTDPEPVGLESGLESQAMLALLVLGPLLQERSEAESKKLKGTTFLFCSIVLDILSNVTKYERILICLPTTQFRKDSTVKTKQIRKLLEFPFLYNCY